MLALSGPPANLSIRDVAREFGVDPMTVRRWEREGRIPKAQRLGRFRRYSAADIEAIRGALSRVTPTDGTGTNGR